MPCLGLVHALCTTCLHLIHLRICSRPRTKLLQEAPRVEGAEGVKGVEAIELLQTRSILVMEIFEEGWAFEAA